jgi:ligand-binding sensor domain-containing protein
VDGSRPPAVRVIRQTSDGYLWLGTRAGLVRFDGATFTTCDSSNTPALTEDHILSLAAGTGGTLWVGAAKGALVEVNRDVFRSHIDSRLAAENIRALLVDSRGKLWVGTELHGLFRMDGGVLVHVPTGPARQDALIRGLFQDAAGRDLGRHGRWAQAR